MLHFVVRSLILFVCGQILLTQAAAQSRAPQTKLQDGFPGESWQRIPSLERAAGPGRNWLLRIVMRMPIRFTPLP